MLNVNRIILTSNSLSLIFSFLNSPTHFTQNKTQIPKWPPLQSPPEMCRRGIAAASASFLSVGPQNYKFLCHVALGAQRPIVVKHSRGHLSVRTYVRACVYIRASVGLSSSLWKNGGSDPDGVWHHGSDGTGPGMRQVVRFGDRSTGRGIFGANLERAIVTNGDFTAYSQITLSRLVFIRPRRSRSAAAYAYTRQTFPWTIYRSVRTYVRT